MTDLERSRASILALPTQCLQGWQESRRVVFPASYRTCTNVALVGTGGSAFGAEIVLAWGADRLRTPVVIASAGNLPAWANAKTLVVAVSYSGSTEEVVRMAKEAHKRGCKLVIVAKGAELAAFARQKNIPAYIFDDRQTNVSLQPRMGVGITFFAGLGILSRLGYVKVSTREVMEAVRELQRQMAKGNFEKGATALAKKLHGRIPLLIGAEHLRGVLRATRNQIHENAKQFAVEDTIPELNHHLMEGLTHPRAVRDLVAVFFASTFYQGSIARRMSVTQEVMRRQHIPCVTVPISAKTPLAEALVLLQFGSLCSFALVKLNGVNPNAIPWVDYFKKKLAR
ncbi:hypothetical protein HYW18_00575 [Candidatus Uhrbacteria bacterium]|nr:hypothetical protein [Candidatus Uhrbacteria bacterium]